MKPFLAGVCTFVFLFSMVLNAQSIHKWKPLIVNEHKRIWFDEANLDSAKGDKFEVWLLQTYVSPVNINGVKGDVYRAMTLYTVDLSTVKYGIEKICYYDEDGKELNCYEYNIKDFEDSLKYTYPVIENSSIHLVIKELYKNSPVQKK